MQPLTDAELEALLDDLEPFDFWPRPSATLADLSRSYFEEVYLPSAFAKDVLAANDRTYEERLASCRMIVAANDPTPTVLGLLVLAQQPQRWLLGAYIQFLRVQGTEWAGPVVDEAVLDGRLARMIERLDDRLLAHNRVAVDFTSGPVEKRHYTYPPEALQQLTRNAVMHRTYEGNNAPVRIYWFDDRIEIISMGGPFGDVTPENFGQPGFASYRNPHLAEAMRVLNLIQRFGVGIAIAQAALKANGNPPVSFQVDASAVFARVDPTRL